MSDARVISDAERAFLGDLAKTFTVESAYLGSSFVAFDVGANCGEWTAALLDAIPWARVWAFEPQAAAASEYRHRHGGPGIHLAPFGLSSMSGERTLIASDHPACVLATMHERPDRDDYHGSGVALDREETVEVVTLDGFLTRHPVERINLLKIDVEGHEYDVLVGGADTIRTRVDLIQFEFNDCAAAANVRFGDLYHALQSAGYESIWRLRDGLEVCEGDVAWDDHDDFVAVHHTCRWRP